MVRSASPLERDFQEQVVKLAHLYGWCGFHVSFSHGSVSGVHARGRGDDHYDSDGWPDWVFVHPQSGRLLYRELKREREKLTESQKRWHRLLTLAGQDVTVWYPSDLEEIARVFAAR